MNLKEETKGIIENRPNKAERAEAKIQYKRKRQAKGGIFPKKPVYAVIVLIMGITAIALMVSLIIFNIFPADLTMILVLITLGMLVVTSLLMARRTRWKRVLGILFAMMFLVVIGSITYYMNATYAMMNKISENEITKNNTGTGGDVDPTSEAFNLYITGIDRWAGELDLDRSDVNMIMTINPVTKKILLTSIPRDTYVKLHTAQQMDKLTHTGIYGVEETLSTVEDWLGVKFAYYVKLNFSSMRGIINAIGGIDVYSPVAFDSDISDCTYKKGWNHLNGREALYFARERHAFEGQDSVRVENQQRVVKAVIKKLTTSATILTSYSDILSVAGSNMSTNMSADEIQEIVKMQMNDLASWNVETQKIKGEYDMDYVASLSSKNMYSVYRPDSDSVESCLEGIDKVLNPTAAELEEAKKNSTKGFVVNAAKRIKQKISGKNKDSEEEEE